MTISNKTLGANGEEIAAQFLINRGDEILARNWRIREGELDLVTLDSAGLIHMIEVKTRTSTAFGHPLEAIDSAKAHRIQRLSLAWLATNGALGCDYQIDAIAILIASDGSHSIEVRANVL
ncbi:MAG: YraN family protein [Candidatus Nanopelagicaceae bacterium]|nr:YraN family protein [Candidatus Nanopelagicaceae bacterium]